MNYYAGYSEGQATYANCVAGSTTHSQEIRHSVARGHHAAILLCLREVLDLLVELVIKAQDAGHIATAIAVVGS